MAEVRKSALDIKLSRFVLGVVQGNLRSSLEVDAGEGESLVEESVDIVDVVLPLFDAVRDFFGFCAARGS